MICDASALVEFLIRSPRAPSLEGTISDPASDLNVPALCDVEVVAALRRLELSGAATEKRIREALDDYRDLPLTRHGHLGVLERVHALRKNFSSYDATYVSLAERLGASLLTADGRLARAVRELTGVEVV